MCKMKAVVLAAGSGTRLRPFTNEKPKCLIDLGRCNLLERSLGLLSMNRISNVIIIVGYCGDIVKETVGCRFGRVTISYVVNDDYETTSTMRSLYQAKEVIDGDALILDGDLVYSPDALSCVIESEIRDIVLISFPSPSDEGAYVYVDKDNNRIDIRRGRENKARALGEFVGITKLTKESMKELYRIAENDFLNGITDRYYEEAILMLSKIRPVKCLFKDVMWVGINRKQDLFRAWKSTSSIPS